MKIAMVRAGALNKFEMQTYELLAKKYDITAYTSMLPEHDINLIELPKKQLLSVSDFTGWIPFPWRHPLNWITNKSGLFGYMFGLEEELKDKDIAHVCEITNAYSYQAVKAKKKYGTKVVTTVWENIPMIDCKTPFEFFENKFIRKEVCKNTDMFIAVTNKSKETLMLDGVPDEKITVIPAGIDITRFKGRKKNLKTLERYGLESSDFVILFVGRLVWQKGIYDLIYSAAKIAKDAELKKYNIKFLLIGNGVEKTKLQNKIKKLGLDDTVKIINGVPYDKIHEIYNIADLFVLPSIPIKTWSEQFGVVLIEAMSSGLPIITTSGSSIPDVVGDAAIITPPADWLSLYKNIKKVVLDKNLRNELSLQSKKRTEKEFDSIKVAKRIEEVYLNLLEE